MIINKTNKTIIKPKEKAVVHLPPIKVDKAPPLTMKTYSPKLGKLVALKPEELKENI